MRTVMFPNLVLALALIIGSPLAFPQSSDEAAVAQAVEAFRKAVIAKDRGQLDALIADPLRYWHTDGRVETKAEYIADAISKRALWKSIELTNQTIVVTGDTAIVRHNYSGESEREGGKIQPTRVGVFMVWQKQDGRWRLLARQAIPFQKAPGAA